MKGLLFLFAATFAMGTAMAETEKPAEERKLCYYADGEYSAGAILAQAGKKMQCVLNEEGTNLVWREFETGRLSS